MMTATLSSVDKRDTGAPVTRRPRRERHLAALSWLVPIRIGQIAVWQIAALAVLANGKPDDVRGIVVTALAGVAVALTSVRLHGLCAYQWIGVHVGYRRRRRARRRAGGSPDPLALLLPDLRTRRHVDRAGNRIGLAHVDDGWSAVLRLSSSGQPDPAALVAALRAAYQRTDIRLSSAELVVWTVPSLHGPTPTGPGKAQPAGDARTAAHDPIRVHWLAVRYRPAEAPMAAIARGGDELGALRATASAALGLAADLERAGHPCAVADEPELRESLLIALGADRSGHGDPPAEEDWRSFSAGRIRQYTFVPRHQGDAVAVLRRWVPWASFTSTSLLLFRTPHGKVRRRVIVRVGVPRDRAAGRESPISRLGVGLVPCNGRHAGCVRSALPLALDRDRPL